MRTIPKTKRKRAVISIEGTPQKEMADRVLAHLRAAAAEITGLALPHPKRNAFVRGHRTVPAAAIAEVIDAVEHSSRLQNLHTFDPAGARDALRFNLAFKTVVDAMKTLLSSVIFTMESQKATAATQTLQMYAIMRGLARKPDDVGDNLYYYVEAISAILRPRGKGRKKPKTRRRTKQEVMTETPKSKGAGVDAPAETKT